MESRQGLVASGSQFSQDIWQDDGTRMSDSRVTSRRCDLHSYQFGWLRGIRNSLGQNSFWLRRPDLNQRLFKESTLSGPESLLTLARQEGSRTFASVSPFVRYGENSGDSKHAEPHFGTSCHHQIFF